MEQEMSTAIGGVEPPKLWDDAVDLWLSELDVRPATLKTYNAMLKWLHPMLGGSTLADVTQDVVTAVRKARASTGAGATVTLTMYVLGSVLNRAEDEGWIDKAPKARPGKKGKEIIRWLEPDEMSRLLANARGVFRDMILVALNTGIRSSNVVAMRWDWVDIKGRVIRIPASHMKTGRPLVVPMNTSCLDAVTAQQGRDPDYVFVRDNGQRFMHWPRNDWVLVMEKADIKGFRAHDMRHHWASMHVMLGTPLHVLKELGGWSSYDMVLRYAHLSTQHLSQHAATIETGR